MRIFLSYPSEERDVAERINYALLARHHDVFFDRSDLPAGGEFDAAIADFIARSDLFIFLITPASVETGRYTLSELRIASRRWPHPAAMVLPVLLRPTAPETIPRYLRAVNILEPHGEVGAEVADAVEALASLRARPRRRRAVLAATAVGVLLVAGAIGSRIWRPETSEPPAIETRDPLLGEPLPAEIRTRARAVAASTDGYVVALTEPPQLRLMTDDHQQIGSSVPLTGEPVDIVQMPTQYFVVTRSPDEVVVFDRKTLKTVVSIPVVPPVPGDASRLSTEVRSVAMAVQNVLWIVTAGSDGASALLKHRFVGWQMPTWIAGKYTAWTELGITACHRLRTIGGTPWLVADDRCVRGGRLYRIEGAIRVDEYTAEKYPITACVSDIAESSRGNLLLLSCAGELHEARLDAIALVPERSQRVLVQRQDQGRLSSGRIATGGRDVFIATTTEAGHSDGGQGQTSIARVEPERVVEIGRFPGASPVSLTVSPRSVVVVMKDAGGRFESVALPRNSGS